MSKRSRKGKKRSTSQVMFLIMSGVIAASMVLSIVVAFLPQPAPPTPTPWPTWTPSPIPSPTATPTPSAEPSPTLEPTAPVIGPELPTATPTLTPTATLTPTLSPTPASAVPATDTPAPALAFAVCGDSRNDPGTYRQVLEGVMAGDSEFLINTGDLVNEGTETRWKEFRDTMAGFTLPFYPVPGNHDALNGDLEGYLAHSGAPAEHYSFDRGPVHFTLADSHHGGITGAELAWLREDLSATDQPVKMVFLHHPPFDPDGTDHIMAFGNEGFMDLMVEQGVDYVFAGHIHAYAREERDGVDYVITGGAGAPLYGQDHPHAFHHYLHVTVQGERVTIEIVKI